MTDQSVASAFEAIVAKHGEWNAYNVRLAEGVYTLHNEHTTYADARVLTMLQLASDLVGRPLDEQRVLDLGPLEGLFGLEFAAHGAEVVGVEGREDNVARANFMTETLGLTKKVNWTVGDAREISKEVHGDFDVILCLGLLYHLDGDDQLPFLRRLAECCNGIAIIDTHIATRQFTSITDSGKEYGGRWYHEHDSSTSLTDRMKATRSSLDNERSFWLTRAGLFNGLRDAGFSTVLELPPIPEVAYVRDRVQLIAFAGSPVEARIQPNSVDVSSLRMRELDTRGVHKSQDPTYKARQTASRVMPEGLKEAARTARGRLRAFRG